MQCHLGRMIHVTSTLASCYISLFSTSLTPSLPYLLYSDSQRQRGSLDIKRKYLLLVFDKEKYNHFKEQNICPNAKVRPLCPTLHP